MKLTIKELPDEIELIRDGKVIAKWIRAEGSWKGLTNKVCEDGNWSRFLVFEEIKE